MMIELCSKIFFYCGIGADFVSFSVVSLSVNFLCRFDRCAQDGLVIKKISQPALSLMLLVFFFYLFDDSMCHLYYFTNVINNVGDKRTL